VEISERKKIQDALRKSKEYFQTIIEHGFECVCIVDSEGKINFISQPVERILGYQPDELRGMSVFSHIHPEEIRESTEKMVDLLQKPGETNRSVTRIQSKKGEWLYIETVSTNLLHDEAIAGIVVNFRDISQSIQTARELKESKLLLEKKVAARTVQLQRSVTDLENFAYLVSHDLQEPLRTIVSYLQLLELRFGGKMDPGGLEFLEYAVNGAKRMKNLLNGILEYSRIRKNEPRREQTDLNQVVKEVINDLSSLTKEKQAFISREPLPVIMADKAQMIRLFQNLIGNALKFSGEKNPPVIRVYGGKIGNQPVISIEDNGIGIEPSSGNKIFGMFQRLHTEETYSGLGIGLSICQEIVQRHNGRIWFESRPGKGTTFHFTLDP
jgi:PAS domain S-box-containing protein